MNKNQAKRFWNHAGTFLSWQGWAGSAVFVAVVLAGIGWWLVSIGDSDEPVRRPPEDQVRVEDSGSVTGSPSKDQETLLTKGIDAYGNGLYPEALNYFRQALVIAREVEDRVNEGTILHHVGNVYTSQGRHRQALENLRQALVIRREVGDLSGEGAILCEGRRDNVPPGRSSAEMWRLKTVPPVAFNQERPNLIEGGLDVQGGDVPASSQGLFRRRDERPRGGPSVQATPGHGAQDARVLRAPRVSTATTGSQTEARSI